MSVYILQTYLTAHIFLFSFPGPRFQVATGVKTYSNLGSLAECHCSRFRQWQTLIPVGSILYIYLHFYWVALAPSLEEKVEPAKTKKGFAGPSQGHVKKVFD